MAARGRKNADVPLALALASGKTLQHAALAAGVSERTAARRWSDAAFRRRVTELQAETLGQAMGRLADGAIAAVATLRKLLRVKKEGIRLQAAKALLELTMKMRQTVDQEQRLQALEAALADKEPQ
jgi:HEAT repeat protein